MNVEPRPRRMRLAPLLSWSAALGAVAWWLLDAGGTRLAAPPGGRPGTWAAWAEARSPIDVAFTSLRLLALAAVVYLLVITAVGLTCRLIGRDSWIRATDRATLGVVRRLLDGAVGIGFTASALGLGLVPTVAHMASASAHVQLAAPAGEATMSAAPGYGSTATMLATALAPAPAGTATMLATSSMPPGPPPVPVGTATMAAAPAEGAMAPPGTDPPGRATMTAAGPALVAAPPSTATMTAAPASGPDSTVPAPPPETPTSVASPQDDVGAATTDAPSSMTGEADPPPAVSPVVVPTAAAAWTVAAGDHLWSIAERAMNSDGAQPTEDEVAAYWHQVVEANQDALVDPDCPDLIFIGQVITLPPR